MCSVESLREFVNERLTAAAEEILGVFQRSIVEYEEEIDRQRRLLDIVLKPEIKLHRTELPQQHVCKEEEVVPEQQLCIEERKSSVDQEEPEPPQIKEEEEEVCSSQEGEQLVVKQETDGFMLTPADEESEHSEDQTLDFIHDDTQSAAQKESEVNIPFVNYVIPNSDYQLLCHNSHVAESQDEEEYQHGDSGSTRNTELQAKSFKKRHHESNNHSNSSMSEIHCKTHTAKKSFKCDTCGKALKFKCHLYTHMRIHTGERPYPCKICGRDFRYNRDLKVHMRTHTGENPFICKTCGRSFRENSYLKLHMRVHTGEKPFECTTCGKAFRRRSNFNVHMRTHTGERPYLCMTCGKRFCEMSSLTRHIRIHTAQLLEVKLKYNLILFDQWSCFILIKHVCSGGI
uniref:zinc finger protein 664-like n=1 Tax=Epinephelus lanceolatus TaxID=310571 RepID=UPI0014461046|nr:zinc finger protein 664-like [Epinephelus lanceolatus]